MVALESVDLTINPGEFISFVGPSGCGKSTLLNMIAGLLPKTSGQVLIHGQPVAEPSKRVGFMFQAPVLLPWRTVENNVLMPAEVFGLKVNDIRDKARAVLKTVGLGDFINAYPRQLSGGMQQRVALARVLTYEPEVLLMDEPFGALDEFTREAMNLELLRITRAANITVLFVTHNITEAVFMSDRVVVMTPRPGKVSGIIDVPLPRPREIELMHQPMFTDLTFQVRSILGGTHGGH
ncbi:ABC transporter related protein [Rubellimicrobium mesophilum DSM 19309]|uniref:ABC transporter related protein n=1 Tax=Rubellimicrobium mesophilum DSM 19309 TaxID=442562 RepID=A0A017HLD2_9RHOB|nr:ABC transporter related protein [Rubellimicrobium mesophilum DSM 19309]